MIYVCIEDHWTLSGNFNPSVFVSRGSKTVKSIIDIHHYTSEVLICINGVYYYDLIKYYVELSEWIKLQRDEKLKDIC